MPPTSTAQYPRKGEVFAMAKKKHSFQNNLCHSYLPRLQRSHLQISIPIGSGISSKLLLIHSDHGAARRTRSTHLHFSVNDTKVHHNSLLHFLMQCPVLQTFLSTFPFYQYPSLQTSHFPENLSILSEGDTDSGGLPFTTQGHVRVGLCE